MSIDHPPDSFMPGTETLNLRDQLRVKTASVLDELGKSHDVGHCGAWWSDPFSDRRFSLTARSERYDTGEVSFRYKLRVLEKSKPTVRDAYDYDSFFPQISKAVTVDDRVVRSRCSDEDIVTMLGYLDIAPASLTPEENAAFTGIMTEGGIRDPRFHMQLKRFAARALDRFHR